MHRWFATRRRLASLVVVLVVGSTLLGASALVSAQTFAHGLFAPTVTRQQILARAQTWVDAHVPYSQSRWYQGYRTDCSGYVSMAWALSQSYTTYTLNQVAHLIVKSELQPGDVLNKRTDVGGSAHVVLFAGWADASHTTYNGYEENPYWGGAHYTAGIPFPYWPGSYRSIADYQPMRLNGLDGSTSASAVPVVAPSVTQPARPTASPTPAPPLPSTVYVTDANGTLHALDGQRAHELWRYQTGGVLESLTVANGQVLTATAGQVVNAQGERPLALVALKTTNGMQVWQWKPGCLVGVNAVPLACGIVGQAMGTVFVASGGALTALDVATGQPRWTYSIGTDALTGATVAGTTLYVSHSSVLAGTSAPVSDVSNHTPSSAPLATLDALNAANGALLWRVATAGGVADSTLVAANGIVYISVQAAPGTAQALQAFDGHSGHAVWQVAVAPTSLVAPTSGGSVYITTAGESGHPASLIALAAHNGQRLWSQACGASAPMPAATTLYAVCGGGNAVLQVAALDPATGRILWQHAVGADVSQLTLAALADGIVYATATTTTTTTASATTTTGIAGASTSAPTAPTPSATAFAGATSAPPAASATTRSANTTTTTVTTTALDAQAGTVLWQRAGTLAAAARGLACVVSADGTLTALAARTNTMSWLFELGSATTSSQAAITA